MLTPTQFSVLACYEELATTRPALPTQKDVCDYAALEKMLVSDATRALIKSKLLSAKPNETDRRANSINLTPKGRTTLKNAIAIVEKLDQQLFADTTSLVRELRSILAASATESSKG